MTSILSGAFLVASVTAVPRVGVSASLEEAFVQPPDTAKPRVWWHWMNGNVSKAGITADLEAMAEAGIGGAHVFDVGCNVPEGPVRFATPAWDEHLLWAIREAERLGLELTLVNCSGYANAGGPWVAPSNSMFFVAHSETVLKGGERFVGRLPRVREDNGFYRDIATVAFPQPACETAVPDDFAVASPATNVFVFSASAPFTLRGLEFAVDISRSWGWARRMTLAVETSEDGRTWTSCDRLSYPVVESGKSDCDITRGQTRLAAFPKPRTARYLRFTADLSDVFRGGGGFAFLATLKPVFRCALPELNARLLRVPGRTDVAVRETAADEAVDATRLVELTDRFAANGTLDWTPPAGGAWIVVRLGYLASGVECHPCSRFGGGPEVDKFDAAAVAKHLDAYVLRYAKHRSVVSVLCDSYEVGSQNWTHGLERHFAFRKGYSIVPYLAVAASGRVLGSMARTDAALVDFRRVLSDLFAENFAGTFARKCAENGITATLEPYGEGPFNDMAYAWRTTQPMTEFWTQREAGVGAKDFASHVRCVKSVASSAHLRGIPVVDAEGFTAFPTDGGRWTKDPFGLKAVGDLMYAHGVSRMVYHRWAHQPWTDPPRLPGMTMGMWGTHFERTETWWPMVGPWLRYQARCQCLLQQGAFVADVLVFGGDDVPRRPLPDGLVPEGVDWDLCGFDALRALTVVGGRLKCLAGTTYALLLVPTNVMVSAESQAVLDTLARAGARIVRAGTPLGLERDFMVAESRTPASDASPSLAWTHRRYADGREGYFVAYGKTNAVTVVCSFRVTGKVPTLWDAETGARARPRAWRTANGRTEVTVDLRPCGSVFVMFGADEDKSLPVVSEPKPFAGHPLDIETEISFPVDWYSGGTAVKTVRQKGFPDWTSFEDDDLRYFSGIATYRFDVPEKGVIDFGEVCNVAEVRAGGRIVATLWRPPYRCAVPKGSIEVRVANLWPNRLIGDERLPSDRIWTKKWLQEIPAWVDEGKSSPTGRRTFTTWRHWCPTDGLLPSGILGPVRLETRSRTSLPMAEDFGG